MHQCICYTGVCLQLSGTGFHLRVISIILGTYLHDVRIKLTKTHVSMTGVQCGSRVWMVVMLGILDC